jgi:hypothetical protein
MGRRWLVPILLSRWDPTPDYHRTLASNENWSKDFLLGDIQRIGGNFKLAHRRRVFLGIVLILS